MAAAGSLLDSLGECEASDAEECERSSRGDVEAGETRALDLPEVRRAVLCGVVRKDVPGFSGPSLLSSSTTSAIAGMGGKNEWREDDPPCEGDANDDEPNCSSRGGQFLTRTRQEATYIR